MLNLFLGSSLRRLKQPLFHDPSAFLSSKMCLSGNGTRSVRRSGKYRAIRRMKFSESQTGNFGRMERALCFPKSRINEKGGNEMNLDTLGKGVSGAENWNTHE